VEGPAEPACVGGRRDAPRQSAGQRVLHADPRWRLAASGVAPRRPASCRKYLNPASWRLWRARRVSCTLSARPADCGACLRPANLPLTATTLPPCARTRGKLQHVVGRRRSAWPCRWPRSRRARRGSPAAGTPRAASARACRAWPAATAAQWWTARRRRWLGGSRRRRSRPSPCPPGRRLQSRPPAAHRAWPRLLPPSSVLFSPAGCSVSVDCCRLDVWHTPLTGYGEGLDACVCQRPDGRPSARQRRRRSPVKCAPVCARGRQRGAPRAGRARRRSCACTPAARSSRTRPRWPRAARTRTSSAATASPWVRLRCLLRPSP